MNRIKKIILIFLSIPLLFSCSKYNEYKKKGYASDAKIAIKEIAVASEMFKNERGDYPSDLFDLEKSGLIDLSLSMKEQWMFEFDMYGDGWYLEGIICAISTYKMPDGEGNSICYDISSGIFEGYGQTFNKDVSLPTAD